jgi:hypothetical protein
MAQSSTASSRITSRRGVTPAAQAMVREEPSHLRVAESAGQVPESAHL